MIGILRLKDLILQLLQLWNCLMDIIIMIYVKEKNQKKKYIFIREFLELYKYSLQFLEALILFSLKRQK